MPLNKRGRGEPAPPTEAEVRRLEDAPLLDMLCGVSNHFDGTTTASESRSAEETERVCRAEVLRRMAFARAPSADQRRCGS